jgi:hypothetical protein
MADEISIEDIQRKQADMTTLAAQLMAEKDKTKSQALTATLKQQSEDLQRMARAFEAQQQAKHGPPKQGGAEVALTEEQRKRVEGQTGVRIASIWLRDDSRTAAQSDPQIIEDAALEEARRRKREAEAAAQSRAMAEQVLAQIEGASPAGAARVAELKADPNFLGGMLAQKK